MGCQNRSLGEWGCLSPELKFPNHEDQEETAGQVQQTEYRMALPGMHLRGSWDLTRTFHPEHPPEGVHRLRHIFPSHVHTDWESDWDHKMFPIFSHILNNGSSDVQWWKWSWLDSCPRMEDWRKWSHIGIRFPGIFWVIAQGKDSQTLKNPFLWISSKNTHCLD